jgi:hypothetical protein
LGVLVDRLGLLLKANSLVKRPKESLNWRLKSRNSNRGSTGYVTMSSRSINMSECSVFGTLRCHFVTTADNSCDRDKDFEIFNERKEEMELMKGRYKQMELRLESLEKTLAEVEGAGRFVYSIFVDICYVLTLESHRVYRRHIQSMEAHHPNAAVQGEDLRQTLAKELAAFVAEKTVLMNTKDQLRERNAELVEELEEMRAMVEVLKGQISRRKGLVSDPRASPTLG